MLFAPFINVNVYTSAEDLSICFAMLEYLYVSLILFALTWILFLSDYQPSRILTRGVPTKSISSMDDMKRSRSNPDLSMSSQPLLKKHRSSDDINALDPALSTLVDDANSMDDAISPKTRGPLRVVNTSPKGKQPLRETPVLRPDETIVFVNQDGQPINVRPMPKYNTSSDAQSRSPPEAYTASNIPSDMVPLLGGSALKPKPRAPSDEMAAVMPVPSEQSLASTSSDADDVARRGSTPDFRRRHPSEGYEDFETVKPKIETLLTEGLWKGRPLTDFKIQKLSGGSYNRIVSIRVKEPPKAPERTKGEKLKRTLTKMRGKVPAGELERFSKFTTTHTHGDFILRIPRLYRSPHSDYNFEADERMHDFVQDLGIDCPKIVTFAGTQNGIVPFPYLLQEKIVGKSVWYWYQHMIHEQRLQLAKQIGEICRKMTEQPYPFYGKLVSLGPPHKGEQGTIIRDQKFEEPKWLQPTGISKIYPVAQILQQAFAHHSIVTGSRSAIPWRKLCAIVQKLETKGAFGQSQGWYFTHGDFYPRNLMTEIFPGGDARITAVLDWDQGSFQPAVMACRPPSWLWQRRLYWCHSSDEDSLDIIAGMEPTDPHEAEIKKAFDEAAGPEYCRIAYHEYAYTARKLTLWAQMGCDNRIGSRWVDWVNWFVDNWESLEESVRKHGFQMSNGRIGNPMYR